VRRIDLTPRMAVIAAGIGLLVLAGAGAGVGYWLHSRPVLHIATSAQECVNAPDHLASLSATTRTPSSASATSTTPTSASSRRARGQPSGMFDSLLSLSATPAPRLRHATTSRWTTPHPLPRRRPPRRRHPLVDVARAWPPSVPPGRPTTASSPTWWAGLPAATGRPASRSGALPPTAGHRSRSPTSLSTPSARPHRLPVLHPSGQVGLLQGLESAPGPARPLSPHRPRRRQRLALTDPDPGAGPVRGEGPSWPCADSRPWREADLAAGVVKHREAVWAAREGVDR